MKYLIIGLTILILSGCSTNLKEQHLEINSTVSSTQPIIQKIEAPENYCLKQDVTIQKTPYNGNIIMTYKIKKGTMCRFINVNNGVSWLDCNGENLDYNNFLFEPAITYGASTTICNIL